MKTTPLQNSLTDLPKLVTKKFYRTQIAIIDMSLDNIYCFIAGRSPDIEFEIPIKTLPDYVQEVIIPGKILHAKVSGDDSNIIFKDWEIT